MVRELLHLRRTDSTAARVFGYLVTGAEASSEARYVFVLAFTVVLAIVASNLVRGRIGRMWMAIRDMDIAAELIGIKPLQTKLLAFAVSSFYCGVAGALWSFCYINTVEALAFDIFVLSPCSSWSSSAGWGASSVRSSAHSSSFCCQSF